QSGASISASTAGAYSLTAIDGNGCSTSSSVTNVTVNTPQVLTITPAGSTTICQGSSVTLNASAGFTNYSWTTPSGNQSGASISASTAGAYSLTATGSNGCQSTSSAINVTLITPQTLSNNPSGILTSCQTNPITITAIPGFTGYSWSTPAGIQSGSSVIASVSGTYTLSAIDANGCLSTANTNNVTLFAPTPLNTTPSGNISICEGSQITVTASLGFTGLLWSTPTIVSSGNSINASLAGIYSVSGLDNNNCPSQSENFIISITSPEELSISPSGSLSICSGESIELNAEAGFTNYTWSTPSGNQPGNPIMASAEGEYSVIATDGNGCESSSEIVNVSIQNTVSLAVSPSENLSICPGQSLTLTAAQGFNSYEWNGVPGTSTLLVSSPGTYTATAISSSGCPAQSEEILVVQTQAQELSISPSGNQTLCEGETIALAASTGFTGHSWTSPTGNLSGNSVIVSSEGAYSVSATDLNGCVAQSESISITVFIPMDLSISPAGSLSVCQGESVNLSGNENFTNYIWSSSTFTGSGQDIDVSTAGTYLLTATDENGCFVAAAPVVVSVITPPSLNVNPAGPIFRCPNLSITLTASSGFAEYLWTPGNVEGNSYTAIDAGSYSVVGTTADGCEVSSNVVQFNFYPDPPFIPVSVSGSTTLCPGESIVLSAGTGFTQYLWSTNANGLNITVSTAGNYVVTANDSNGCAANSQSIPVFVDPANAIQTTPFGEVFICEGDELLITAEAGLTDYLWNTLNTESSITINESGNFSVSALNANGCAVSSDEVLVNYEALPQAAFTYIQIDEYTVDFENTSQNATSFFWDFGNDDFSEDRDPSYDFLFDKLWPVSLIACNDCGCDTLNTLVDVIKTGINSLQTLPLKLIQQGDMLFITSNLPDATKLSVQIYNLPGQVVLEQSLNHVNQSELSLNNFSSGIYVIRVQSAEKLYTQKIFIKERF
ncbi:MAG: T9SS type A sorting domain-containing protein, partial [Bacteroidia bacterium]